MNNTGYILKYLLKYINVCLYSKLFIQNIDKQEIILFITFHVLAQSDYAKYIKTSFGRFAPLITPTPLHHSI